MPSELTSFFATLFAAGVVIAILVIIVIACVFIIFNVLTLMVGAKIAGIEKRSFGKAFVSALVINFFWGVLGFILSFFSNPYFGLMAILLVPCMIIKIVYDCSLWRAILAYFVSLIAYMLFAVLIVATGFFIIKGAIDSKKSESVEKTTKVESIKPNAVGSVENTLPYKEPIITSKDSLVDNTKIMKEISPAPKKEVPTKKNVVKKKENKPVKVKTTKAKK